MFASDRDHSRVGWDMGEISSSIAARGWRVMKAASIFFLQKCFHKLRRFAFLRYIRRDFHPTLAHASVSFDLLQCDRSSALAFDFLTSFATLMFRDSQPLASQRDWP